MHITQESDYAVRILYCLARTGRRMGAKEVSEKMSVPLRFALKITGKLVSEGLVCSFKGNRGGYELARPAAEITLLDAISAVEGPYQLSRCLCDSTSPEGCACSRGAWGICTFQHEFDRISQIVNRELAAVSFADLLAKEGRT